ncbi:MAG: hypothetical protein KJ607_03785 [Bacteroidetes bacterium]|nr:hypothetical protein [Bacteroidota bacterium]
MRNAKCAGDKGYETCGDCAEMDNCKIVGGVHKHVPEAKTNLLGLN